MDGRGILKGLGITLGHIFDTYWEDLKAGRKRYFTEEGVQSRMDVNTKGIFTVQYPEERVPVPEEFRFVPFLVYEEQEDGEREIRCTACGICSKVCPAQCIWIDRAEDPETGRPVQDPEHFTIDIDLCMNCGFCAEYCPFDAIKMDHDYELATYERCETDVYHLEKLLKPVSYYAEIRPGNYQREEAERKAAAEKKARRKRRRRSKKK
jgi:NADH-quinone oxidoreductase subunit I